MNLLSNNKFRTAIFILSGVQLSTSILFVVYGALYFYNEESSEVMRVTELYSAGSNDELFAVVGIFLSSILVLTSLVRIHKPLSKLDVTAVFLALILQAIYLLTVEVTSFRLSLSQSNGWVLLLWLLTFVVYWLYILSFFGYSIYASIAIGKE